MIISTIQSFGGKLFFSITAWAEYSENYIKPKLSIFQKHICIIAPPRNADIKISIYYRYIWSTRHDPVEMYLSVWSILYNGNVPSEFCHVFGHKIRQSKHHTKALKAVTIPSTKECYISRTVCQTPVVCFHTFITMPMHCTHIFFNCISPINFFLRSMRNICIKINWIFLWSDRAIGQSCGMVIG